MNAVRKAWCRFYQFCGWLLIPLMPYRKPEILDSVEKIPEILRREQCGKVLIVTDRGVMDKHLGDPLFQILQNAGIGFAVFDETVPNPTIENVENAVRQYRQTQAAGIIAIGGGSSMDLGKIVGARITRPNKSVHKMHGLMKILKTLPPLIAVPTTAGTGSETTLAAVITDSASHYKHTIIDFSLIPRYAVLDYRLTVTLPPHLTAATGMDALTHAVEVYIGRSLTRETRRYALDAVKLIAENLKTAYDRPEDETARRNMLLAAHRAGIAFTVSYVGYVHCVAHTLGGFYQVPHGLANAVLLPIVLEMYGSAVHKPLAELARHAVLAEEADSDSTAAVKFIAWIRAMNRSMGIPEKFDVILEKDIAEMAKRADAEGNPLYPVPVLWDAQELEKIYRAART